MFRAIGLLALAGVFGLAAGCSVLQQEKRTKMTLNRDGTISIEAEGWSLADIQMSASASEANGASANFGRGVDPLIGAIERGMELAREVYGPRALGALP